jgi:crotonobetaine/carnitine-CoA ligase
MQDHGVSAFYLDSRPPEEQILPLLLEKRAREIGQNVFVTEVGGESLTYSETYERASRLATVLGSNGLRPGDRVATLLPNSVDAVVVLCAAALAGAVHAPLNNAYVGSLLQHSLEITDPVFLVIDDSLFERLDNIDLPDGCQLIRRGANDSQVRSTKLRLGDLVTGPATEPLKSEGVHGWADIGALLFTSGTTGASKAVAMPWLQLFASCSRIWQAQELGVDFVMYSPWPINHVSGTGAVYMTMVAGARIVVRDKWSTSSFLADVREYGCTVTTLMGETVGYVSRMQGLETTPLTHLYLSPITPLAVETAQKMGVQYTTNYNSTELCSPIGSQGYKPVPLGSCGLARPGVEIMLVDEANREVPLGTPGQALIRTADPATLNAGYWSMPEATTEAWRDGWFQTGDALRQDANGYFYFHGRMKDRLRSRGENVSADEMEAVVKDHPAIDGCAAVGRLNAVGEDEIVLFVMTSSRLSTREVEEYCRDELPKFMWPREIRIVQDLPTTSTGKVMREQLRDRLTNELNTR